MSKIKILAKIFFFLNAFNFIQVSWADECNKPIAQEQFDFISCSEGGVAIGVRNSKIAILSEEGASITPPIYESITGKSLSDDLIAVKKEGKWGFIDKSGNEKIPFIFDKTPGFSEQRAVVFRNSDKKLGIIDTSGNFIMPYNSEFTAIGNHYSNGLIQFKKDDKVGVMDKNGKIIIQPKYDYISSFYSNGLAEVDSEITGNVVRNMRGFINKQNQIVIPIQYRKAYPASYKFEKSNKIIVSNEVVFGKYGVLDTNNKVVLPLEFDSIDFRNGYFKVSKDGKYGFYNEEGKLAIPLIFDDANNFYEGYANVKQMDKYGFVDELGTIKIALQFDNADSFSEGLAAVQNNNRWGFINKFGHIMIPIQYEKVERFSNGLAAVKIKDKWGFINHRGQLMLSPLYDDINNPYYLFDKAGIANVNLNGKSIVIDKSGKEIQMPKK